jgi:hypothetical protein
MAVVFDEVVGEMRPDREDESGEREQAPPPPSTDVAEVRRALARQRRLDERVAAH